MSITLVDRHTRRIKESLRLGYPGLEKICEVIAHAIDLSSPEFEKAAFLTDDQGNCDIRSIYFCLDQDTIALTSALALHRRFEKFQIPILVTVGQNSGLALLLRRAEHSREEFDHLHPVPLLEQSCQLDLVLGGIKELLARAFHKKYLEDQQHSGRAAETNSWMVVWEDLPDEARESNRAQAEHVYRKLQAIGCDIKPSIHWEADKFEFTTQELEKLAEMEHERWMQERHLQGWTFGPRDSAKKTNPNLVSWSELPAEVRLFNREQIRELPTFLATAGFLIYRLKMQQS